MVSHSLLLFPFQRLEVVVEAGSLCPVGDDPLEAAAALAQLNHLLLDLLVDARNPEEEGRPHLKEENEVNLSEAN